LCSILSNISIPQYGIFLRMDSIADNIAQLKKRIDAAAERAGRNPADILLLAISKTQPVQAVALTAEVGQVHFGENRVQEAREKIGQLPEHLIWHLVGHLQSNKAKYCPDLFSWIHSVDSVSLGREVARRYREKGRVCKVLVQVSVSGEDAKSGCDPEETIRILSTLMEEEGVVPAGLMTMPPFDLDPEAARPYFRALRQLRDNLIQEGFPEETVRELSMGMTGDFEVAVEEGATIVRIGTAIFGSRNY